MPIPGYIEDELRATGRALEQHREAERTERREERECRKRVAQKMAHVDSEMDRIDEWLRTDGRTISRRLYKLGIHDVFFRTGDGSISIVLHTRTARLLVRRRVGMFSFRDSQVGEASDLVKWAGPRAACEFADGVETGAVWKEVQRELTNVRRIHLA